MDVPEKSDGEITQLNSGSESHVIGSMADNAKAVRDVGRDVNFNETTNYTRHNPHKSRLSLLSPSPIQQSHRLLASRPNQTPPRLPRSQTTRPSDQKPLSHQTNADRRANHPRRSRLRCRQPLARPLGDFSPHPPRLCQLPHLPPLEAPPRQQQAVILVEYE